MSCDTSDCEQSFFFLETFFLEAMDNGNLRRWIFGVSDLFKLIRIRNAMFYSITVVSAIA